MTALAAADATNGDLAGSARAGEDYGDLDSGVRAFHARLRQSLFQERDETPLEACFCALLMALDPDIDLARIVSSTPVGSDPLDLSDILNAMANLGYPARTGALAPRDIDARLLPCLMVAPDGADVVVVQAISDTPDGTQFTVYSASEGRTLKWARDDRRMRARHQVYFFASGREKSARGGGSNPVANGPWFSSILARFASTFWRLTAISVALSLVGLSAPLFIMLVYDRVIAPSTLDPLPHLAAGVVLAIVMEWVLRSIRSKAMAELAARLDYLVGSTIFERLIQLPPALIERASVAAQIGRIRTFESVRDFFTGPIFMSVIDLPAVFVAIVVIAVLGGWLALVPVGVSLAYLLLFAIVRRHVATAILEAARAASASQQFAIETFEKLESIRGAGLADRWLRMYGSLSGRENAAQLRLFFLGSVGETLAHGLTLISAISTLCVGVMLIWSGSATAGALIASMILTWRVLTPFHSLCTMIPRFEQMGKSIQQINELMELATEAEGDDISARPTEFSGRIAFVNASVRYNRESGPVLLGLNAEIRAGDAIAISGPNGSGKSSLLKLALGLYPTLTGSVRIDGVDLRQIPASDLRRMIAYVPQSPDLLAGSIADNLRFGRPLATEDELWRALDIVGASEEVRALRRGLATDVQDEGERLSAALRHRLSLARALLPNSALLLIDEQPNAVLNAGLGEVIKQVIQRSRGKRTVIFVSHRVDLMRLADRVIQLRPGQTPLFSTLDNVLERAA